MVHPLFSVHVTNPTSDDGCRRKRICYVSKEIKLTYRIEFQVEQKTNTVMIVFRYHIILGYSKPI